MKKMRKWLAVSLGVAMLAGYVPALAAPAPTLAEKSATVYVNGSSYRVKVRYASGYTVAYSSGNAKVAKVTKNGEVTGVKAGKTTVTVSFRKAGHVTKKKLSVTVRTGVKSISIDNMEEIEKEVGTNHRIRMDVSVTPKNHDDDVVYRTSDSSVAAVSSKGNIRTAGAGTATITVVAKGSGKSRSVVVTVKDYTIHAEQTGAHTFHVTSGTPFYEDAGEKQDADYDSWKDLNEEAAQDAEKPNVMITEPTLDVKVKTVSGETPCSYTVSDDGKSLEVKTTAAIRTTNYTISVNGRETEVKGEAEEAKEFKIAGDKLYLTDIVNGKATKAVVGYGMFNQFGEKMKNNYNVSGNCSLGELTVDRKHDRLISTILPNIVTVGTKHQIHIYTDDMQQNATAELTLVAQPHVASLEFEGIYQPDGKELNTSYTGTDEYYLLISAKDQYGNKLTDPMDSVVEQQPLEALVVNFSPGMTNLELASNTVEQVEVSGENHIALRLALKKGAREANAGDANLMIISPSSGATLQQPITVNYGSTVDEFEVLEPVDGVVVACEETEFTYRAVDVNGDPVEDIRELKKVLVRSNQTSEFEFRKEDGRVKLLRKKRDVDPLGIKNTMFLTNTLKSSHCLYTVHAKARPTMIAGYKGLTSSLSLPDGKSSGSIVFEANDFQIADQYGRVMGNFDIYDDPEFASEYGIAMSDDSKKNFLSSAQVMILEDQNTFSITPRFANTNKYIEFMLVDRSGEKITDEIYDEYVNQRQYDVLTKNYSEDSACDILIHSVNARKISKYEVEEIPDLYFSGGQSAGSQSPYASDVIVYGVLSDGYRVQLSESAGDFTLNLPSPSTLDSNDAGGQCWMQYNAGLGKLYLSEDLKADDFVVDDRSVNSFTRKIEIIPNNDADHPIEKEIEISRRPLEVQTATLRELSEASDQLPVGDEIRSVNVSVADLERGALDFIDYLNYTDQYGANNTSPDKRSELDKSVVKSRIKYYVSDVDSDDGYITSNGSLAPKYENFVSGDSFRLRMVIDRAEVSLWINVTD